MKRRLAIAILVFAGFGAAFVQPAVADDGGGPNNIVQVRNHDDGATRIKSKVKVSEDPNDDVEDGNAAIAYASCTDCRTIAAAIQVVIVESPNVTTYQPQNGAVAVNENCTRCATFAFARQIVLTPYHHVELSGDTRRQIHDAGEEAERIVESNADFPTMSAQLKDLATRLAATVQADIDQQSTHAPSRDDREDERVG